MKLSQIPRTTLAYLTAVALLGGVYVVQETRTPQRNAIPVPSVSEEVDRIVMERAAADGESSRVELFRDQDAWRVNAAAATAGDGDTDGSDTGGSEGSPGSYRADQATVDDLLRDMEALSEADVISTRANYEEYGLADGDTRRLRFFVGDTEPVALEFGTAAAAGDAVYGRINGSREIVLLPQSLASAITADPEELRDTAVVRLPEDQIMQVEIRSPDHETLTLSRERPGSSTAAAAGEGEPVWSIEPEREGEPIATGRVRDLFSELNPLRAQEFLPADPEGPFFAEIIVRRTNDRAPEEIRIWPPDDDGRYPLRVSSAEESVLIPEWRARRLLLGLERYFEPFSAD
jgi:hypothetical protein